MSCPTCKSDIPGICLDLWHYKRIAPPPRQETEAQPEKMSAAQIIEEIETAVAIGKPALPPRPETGTPPTTELLTKTGWETIPLSPTEAADGAQPTVPEELFILEEAATSAANLITNCCQILDVVKPEWKESWSDWDQSVRDAASEWLKKFYMWQSSPRSSALAAASATASLSEEQVESVLCGDVYNINDEPDTKKLTVVLNAMLRKS